MKKKALITRQAIPRNPWPNLHAVGGSNGRCMGNAREGTNHLYYKGKKERI